MPDQVEIVEAFGSLNDVQQTQAQGGRFRALLIKAGWGSKGYYSEEVLRRDGPQAWPKGTQGYLDHPTLTEKMERPERSVRHLASETITDPVWDPVLGGLVAEVEVYPQWRALLNEDFAGRVGLSIRATGIAEYGEAEGREGAIVTEITEGISIDWVTRAGAGGRVLELIESAAAQLAEAVSDKPWSDFGQGDYTIEQWRRACLIGPDSASDDKGDYKLPVREPGGALNRNAVHAAAGGHGVSAVTGVSAEKKTAAAKKLVGLYRNQLDEDPPAGLLKAAGMTASSESAAPAGANLTEARNVGQWFEARIHSAFTGIADDMYGQGRLTRDERIALSKAIGDALDMFTARVEADQPQLYKRDLWAPPESDGDGEMTEAARRLLEGHGMTANDLSERLTRVVKETYGGTDIFTWVRDHADGWVVFSLESQTDSALYQQPYTVNETSKAVALSGEPVEVVVATTYAPARPATQTAPGDQQEADASGGKPADNQEMEEGSMPELTDEQVRELEEARTNALNEAAAAKTDAEAARTELARFRAADAARPVAAQIIAESGLLATAQTRILGQVVNADTVPLADAGVLDEAAFRKVVEEAVQEMKTIVAEVKEDAGEGQPRGLGEAVPGNGQGPGQVDPKVTEALTESYKSRGLSPEAARLAAAGRPL